MSATDNKLASALYRGWVRHRRFLPKAHAFRYPLFLFYLNLDELNDVLSQHWFTSLERRNLVSFRREDYFAGQSATPPDLKTAVIARVQAEYLSRGETPPELRHVCLLTQLRLFGVLFNPVSFYYCFDAEGKLRSILAEITNTPWHERHAYVLPVGSSSPAMQYQNRGANRHCFRFDKVFHVSPFNPMNMHYQWNFSEPDAHLRVHMDNLMQTDQAKHFDATMTLERLPLHEKLAPTLLRFPWMTAKVVTGIYWQALKLKLKGLPFYDHPATRL